MTDNFLHAESPITTDEELFWWAIRYVQNDLSESERADFETCLGNDLAACEAVAEAVRLTAGLQAVGKQSVDNQPVLKQVESSRTSAPSRRVFPVVVSAALVLSIGFVLSLWSVSDQPESEWASQALISHWRSESRLIAAELGDFDDFADEDVDIRDESLSVPGWMFSAVQLADEAGLRP